LINALGKVPGLKVPAGTSSFYFRGKSVPVPEIAKQLGVAYVIEGSVQRMGDQVRISARLSKAADGFHEWSETFLRDAKDVFAVEEEIAGLIAKRLSLKLGVSSAAATASVNPEAFELYVQARQAWNLRTAAGFDQAEQLLQRALALEPNFARAHAALADVWAMRGEESRQLGPHGQRTSAAFTPILAAINRALALDPDSAEAHASLGNLRSLMWDTTGAIQSLRRAVELNPNYASAHQWLGYVLVTDGRIDEALVASRRSTELDPLSSRIWDNYGFTLLFAGQYEEQLAANRRALGIQPDSLQPLWASVSGLIGLGRFAEAQTLVDHLPRGSEARHFAQIELWGSQGRRKEALELLGAGSPDKAMDSPLLLVCGERERALAALAPEATTVGALYNIFFRYYDSVRDDPRFREFLATLGVTEAHARAQAWRKAHPPEKPAAKP
jgi:tetratricopeptide (TPR) repeat protein